MTTDKETSARPLIGARSEAVAVAALAQVTKTLMLDAHGHRIEDAAPLMRLGWSCVRAYCAQAGISEAEVLTAMRQIERAAQARDH